MQEHYALWSAGMRGSLPSGTGSPGSEGIIEPRCSWSVWCKGKAQEHFPLSLQKNTQPQGCKTSKAAFVEFTKGKVLFSIACIFVLMWLSVGSSVWNQPNQPHNWHIMATSLRSGKGQRPENKYSKALLSSVFLLIARCKWQQEPSSQAVVLTVLSLAVTSGESFPHLRVFFFFFQWRKGTSFWWANYGKNPLFLSA